MDDISLLVKRLDDLEARVKKLESESEFDQAIYLKAQELVKKFNKSSPIFLQTKLLIDHVRAQKIIDKLKSDGLI